MRGRFLIYVWLAAGSGFIVAIFLIGDRSVAARVASVVLTSLALAEGVAVGMDIGGRVQPMAERMAGTFGKASAFYFRSFGWFLAIWALVLMLRAILL